MWKFITTIVLLAILITAGAEASLPTSFLYPIKLNINEQARELLNTSDQRQLDWLVEKATRRLTEAEKLATTDRLTQTQSENLEPLLSEDIDRILELSLSLAGRDQIDQALAPTVKLHSYLQVYTQIFLGLEEVAEENTEGVSSFRQSLESHQETVGQEVDELKLAAINPDQTFTLDFVETEEDAVADKLDQLTEELTTQEEQLEPEIYADLNDKLATVEVLLSDGQEAIENTEFGLAAVQLVEADGLLTEVEVMLNIEFSVFFDLDQLLDQGEDQAEVES